MFFVLLWIVCAIASAWIATSKGRDASNYGCLGFLLGPLGVVLALAAGRDEEALRRGAVQSGVMRACPSCAEMVRREAVKCRFCGSELPPIVDPDRVTPRSAGRPARVGDALEARFGVSTDERRRGVLIGVAITIAALVAAAYFGSDSYRYGTYVPQGPSASPGCKGRGEAYFRSIGSWPTLSDGRDAYLVVSERCAASDRAF